MPSFSDSIFLFVLALLLFGPKKLPVLARELGKWVGEFRRASNEFKMQMEEELRISEQEERQKKLAAIEAAAPAPPSLPEPEQAQAESAVTVSSDIGVSSDIPAEEQSQPVPIATSGELHMMPPSTGLPARYGDHAVDEREVNERATHASEPESVTHAG